MARRWREWLWWFSVVAGVAAIGLLVYADSIPPFRDPALFERQVLAMDIGDSSAFFELRERLLTSQFMLQDYGMTLALLALLAAVVSAFGRDMLRTPPTRRGLACAGLAAPVIFGVAALFDIGRLYLRYRMPPWADSPGPLIFGAMLEWCLLTLVAAMHLPFLRGAVGYSVSLGWALSWRANLWLSVVAVASAMLAVGLLAEGCYWYGLAMIGWVYFFVSLSASRRYRRLSACSAIP